jgi:hypothetical protein
MWLFSSSSSLSSSSRHWKTVLFWYVGGKRRQSFVQARMNHAKQPIFMGIRAIQLTTHPRGATSSSAVDEPQQNGPCAACGPSRARFSSMMITTTTSQPPTTTIIIKRQPKVAAAPFPFSTILMASWSTAEWSFVVGRLLVKRFSNEGNETRAMIQSICGLASFVLGCEKVRNAVSERGTSQAKWPGYAEDEQNLTTAAEWRETQWIHSVVLSACLLGSSNRHDRVHEGKTNGS